MEPLIKSYAGQPVPASIIIEKVIPNAIPQRVNQATEAPLVDGSIFVNSRYGIRSITVNISVVSKTSEGLFYQQDDLSKWLNHKEPQPLVLRDMPDRTFYCILDGAVDLNKIRSVGQGSFNLICHDPHIYGQTRTYDMDPNTTQVYNGGNEEAYPIINMTLKKDVDSFFITGSEQTIYLGEPIDPTEQTIKDTRPLLFNDTGSSVTPWANATDYHIDGGQIFGTMSSNGYSLQQASKDYGTASGVWHGAAMVRSIGKEVQDFDLEAQIGLLSKTAAEKGRIEVYLLDINNKQLAKISLKDIDSGRDNPMFDAWLGQINNGGVSTVNTYGAYRGVWKQFNGVINIGRRGKQWHFYCAMVNPTTYQHHTRYYKTVTDTWGKFGNKLAKVMIHIGAYGSDKPVDSMWISNVRVNELLSNTASEVPAIGKAGDTFTIDCESGKILRNGKFLTEQYAGTEFIRLKEGANGIAISDETLLESGTIEFTEKWV